MSDLECRWRGQERQGRYPCTSSKIISPNGVTLATCAGCRLRDHEPVAPSLIQKTINLSTAVVSHVQHGMKTVDQKVFDSRIAICVLCPYYLASSQQCRHQSCGCFLRIKAWWQEQKCPLGKWPA